MTRKACRLYLITPPKIEISSFAEEFKKALSGGDIAILQLRLKEASDDDVRRASEALIPICKEHDVIYIVNDSPKLAKEVGADGVHIGEEQDGTVKQAREIMGEDLAIGYSCYASRDRAMTAGEDGADYVAFGAFYTTATKEPKGRPKPEILEWWDECTVLPSVAIGGIKPDNAAPLVKAGADFIAVVTGVWDHEQGPEAAVKEYNKVISSC